MKCPFCGSLKTRVINSRLTGDETSIRRRRECEACDERFTTFEHVEMTPLIVVKRDGLRQTFDRERIMRGLLTACQKRPVPFDKLQELVDEVERELAGAAEKEVSSLRIGEMVLSRLRLLDEVAYVRFASVYRQFRDVREFRDEIEELSKPSAAGGPDIVPTPAAPKPPTPKSPAPTPIEPPDEAAN